jgi:hypothetical protein
MTLRMNLAYVALAALALLLADVATVRAAMVLCNAQPWKCRYSSDGRQYFYYGAGSRVSVSTATPSTGAGTATNSDAWGCGATDGTARGRSWGFPNKAAASFRALSECAKRSTHCHIVSCSSSVHNYNEAGAILYSDAHR